MSYRTWDEFSEVGNVLHTLVPWMGYPGMGLCLAIQMHISMDTLHQNPTSSVLNVKGQGGGARPAINRWLKLIYTNSFTNQNQQFMCFGRWKQQKSVVRSGTGWTLSHLAQTCLQCATNPLLSCLYEPHVHCTCATDNGAVFGKQISDGFPSSPREPIQQRFKAGFVSHWKGFFALNF